MDERYTTYLDGEPTRENFFMGNIHGYILDSMVADEDLYQFENTCDYYSYEDILKASDVLRPLLQVYRERELNKVEIKLTNRNRKKDIFNARGIYVRKEYSTLISQFISEYEDLFQKTQTEVFDAVHFNMLKERFSIHRGDYVFFEYNKVDVQVEDWKEYEKQSKEAKRAASYLRKQEMINRMGAMMMFGPGAAPMSAGNAALLGGVLAGPTGAIIGAASGVEKQREHNEFVNSYNAKVASITAHANALSQKAAELELYAQKHDMAYRTIVGGELFFGIRTFFGVLPAIHAYGYDILRVGLSPLDVSESPIAENTQSDSIWDDITYRLEAGLSKKPDSISAIEIENEELKKERWDNICDFVQNGNLVINVSSASLEMYDSMRESLENEEYDEVVKKAKEILKIDTNNAEVHYIMALAENRVSSDSEAIEKRVKISNTSHYNIIMNSGSPKLKKKVQEIKEKVEEIDGKLNELFSLNGEDAGFLNEMISFGDFAVRVDGKVVSEGDTDNWSDIISIKSGDNYTVGLKSDGTVVAIGDNEYGQCNVSEWTDIISLQAAIWYTVGLRSDGRVVEAGWLGLESNANEWTDIVAIATSGTHTVGLKSNGRVVATGENENGQCDVDNWSGIVSIMIDEVGTRTVGIKADGTIVATGEGMNVKGWTDIIAVKVLENRIIGLKSDGRVVAVGENEYGECLVSDWKDIIAIEASDYFTVGLKSDGTVVATGKNDYGQCDVNSWKDIVSIRAGVLQTVGLRSDGKVFAVGHVEGDKSDMNEWEDIIAIVYDGQFTGIKKNGFLVNNCHYMESYGNKWRMFEDIDDLIMLIEKKKKIRDEQKSKIQITENCTEKDVNIHQSINNDIYEGNMLPEITREVKEEYRYYNGKRISDCVIQACKDLGVMSGDLEYDVIDAGSKGFLGIGAKDVKIKARKKKRV